MEQTSGSVQARSIDNRKVRPFQPSSLQRKRHRLSDKQLKLAISTAIIDGMDESEVVDKLWREHPVKIRHFYQAIKFNRGYAGYIQPVERKTTSVEDTNPLTREKTGMTITELATKVKLKVVTVVALLEHHDLLELVPYGLEQKRRLVTETAFNAHLGHNIYPNRIGRLEGRNRSSPFPVFYSDRLQDILWMFDLGGISEGVGKEVGKKAKLQWLLKYHSYLPDDELASLSGYSRMGVFKVRCRNHLSQTEVETSEKVYVQGHVL